MVLISTGTCQSQIAIKEKIDKALRFKENSERVLKRQEESRKSNEFEVFKRLVEKHENVMNKKEIIDERIQKNLEQKKETFERRRMVALEKIRKSESDLKSKYKNSEKKFREFEKILNERQERIRLELAMKNEEKNLKNFEGLLKVKRAKRKYVIFI